MLIVRVGVGIGVGGGGGDTDNYNEQTAAFHNQVILEMCLGGGQLAQKAPIPHSDIKAQRATKNLGDQYYSHRACGGWMVLNAKSTTNEMKREEQMLKTTAGGHI